uniref:Uncharacterized protein n=1 Tax=Anopheles atroparvus TaxID=41427 RepID=A0A182IPE3_ANOAO
MSTQPRAHRKPPDVEEALSSMLWTPYDNNLSESDSSDEPENLHRLNNNATNYSFFGTGPNHDHRRRQQQSLMRRSLSAWSYRARTTGKPSAGELQAGNRFSYPYYDHTELGVGALGGWGDGGYGNSNHVNGNGSYEPYGYDQPVTGSSYSIHGTAAHHRAPWQTVQPPSGTESSEKRPYLQLQTPFVGRWHRVPAQDGVSGATPLETSSLPFSLLALDNPPAGCVPPGSRSGDDGFADSYRDDYQVYPGDGNGEPMPFGGPRNGSSVNTINNNNNHSIGHDGTCNNSLNNGSGDSGEQHSGNSLCIISAMLNPNAHFDGDSSGNGGDLHFSAQNHHHHHHHHHHQQQPPSPPPPGAVQLHHRWLHRKSASTCLVVANDDTHTVDGRPGQVPIARTPSQRRAAEGGEKEIDESVVVVSHTAGSSARQANGEASSSSLASLLTVGGAQKDRVRAASVAFGVAVGAGKEAGSSRSFPEEAMRLNVPAAGLAEGSRTSVYIPSSCISSSSSSQLSSSSPSSPPVSGADGGLQALTIQVNRCDPNNQQQNDVVNNPSSGVSIVSCYRAAASVSGGAEGSADDGVGGVAGGSVKSGGIQTRPQVNDQKGSECAVENGGNGHADNGERRRRPSVGLGGGGCEKVESSAVYTGVVNSSSEQMVQVSSGHTRPMGVEENREGGGSVAPPPRTYTSTEAQTDDTIQVQPQPQPLQQAPTLQLQATSSSVGAAGAAGGVGPYGGSPGPEPATMLGVHVGGLLMGGSPPPLVGRVGMPPGGSEFSTREHRRRERRERRQARNRLQHIHPLEPPPPPGGPGLHHRSPPPIEIVPDILHSHLPPPYTTLPMGASLIPQMIPGNASSVIPVRAADDCRYTFPMPIMRR